MNVDYVEKEINMRAFTDEQALQLGKDILERFEEGLNGNKWKGLKVVLPIRLGIEKGSSSLFPRDTPWCSSVELSIPYFFRYRGPNKAPEHVTLDEWLESE